MQTCFICSASQNVGTFQPPVRDIAVGVMVVDHLVGDAESPLGSPLLYHDYQRVFKFRGYSTKFLSGI